MKRCAGFTLIELVVVVMIIGLLVAIATPKMLDIMGSATDNAARQSLSVLRDAIETYASQNGGGFPPASTADASILTTAMKPHLRGPFPKCPVGDSGNADSVLVDTTNSPPLCTNAGGWAYNNDTGEIIINVTGYDTY